MYCLRVLAKPVGHVVPKAVKNLTGPEIPLRRSDDIDARRAKRGYRRIAKDRGAGDRERDLEVTKVIWPVKAIEWARPHLESER